MKVVLWPGSAPSPRLIAAFVLLGYLPLLILTGSSVLLSQRAVEREASARVSSLKTGVAAIISSRIGDLPQVLTAMGRESAVREEIRTADSDRKPITDTLLRLVESRPDLDAAFVTDAAGTVLAGAPIMTGVFPNNSRRDWYRGASRSDRAYMSTAYLSSVTQLGLVISVAMRVIDPQASPDDSTVGFMVAVYRLDGLQSVVDALQRSEGARVTITDQTGTVLSSPGRPHNRWTSIAEDPRIKAALAGRSGLDNGAKVISAYGPVSGSGWAMTVDVPKATVAGSYRQLRDTVLVVALILAALMLAALLAAGVTEKKRKEIEQQSELIARGLKSSEQRFRAAFLHAPVGILRLEMDGTILEVNFAFCELLGASSADLLGKNTRALTLAEDVHVTEEITRQISENPAESARGEKRFVRADGEAIWVLVTAVVLEDEAGRPYILSQIVDISERKRAEAQLSELALHDALTGLPNRLLFETRLDQALKRRRREGLADLAVLFIDLDGFKDINDRFGHQYGDEVLREVSIRLQRSVRPADTVARLGGDEFVVLCESAECDAARNVAGRLLDSLRRPGGAAQAQWQVSASIGISHRDEDGLSAAELLNRADAAMYRAKQQGKNCIEVYDLTMSEGHCVTAKSVARVESALANDRLRLHYQPVFDVCTRRIVGAEALIRMVDDDGSLLPPADFLAAAEAHGQIVAFGAWSLVQACQQAASWKAELPVDQEFGIAVNMSVKEIEAAGFLERVDHALERSGLPPDALVIELTESAFLRDLPSGRLALAGLRDRGVKLALDDFGTGFSSLSYLRRFAVDIIKIDRSFVVDLLTDARGARVTHGLVALAHTLGAVLVAEGVEEEGQLQILKSLGAHLVQGYLLSRPLEADAFTELLHRQSQEQMLANVME